MWSENTKSLVVRFAGARLRASVTLLAGRAVPAH